MLTPFAAVVALSIFCSLCIAPAGARTTPDEAPAFGQDVGAGGDDATPPGMRVDANLVYFGNPKRYRRPAVVVLGTIFKEIPAYQQIQSSGLSQADADYWILLNKANAVFNKALARVIEVDPYDLVAEQGGVKAPPGTAVPDITDLVVQELKKGGF